MTNNDLQNITQKTTDWLTIDVYIIIRVW
jgi:hypothetical protein